MQNNNNNNKADVVSNYDSAIIWENNTMIKYWRYDYTNEEDKWYTLLESVGCHIGEDGFTYPHTDEHGIPDLSDDMGVHLEDIEDDEWFDTLSREDIDVLCKIKEGRTALQAYVKRNRNKVKQSKKQ